MLTYSLVDRGTVCLDGLRSRRAISPSSKVGTIPTNCPATHCLLPCLMGWRRRCCDSTPQPRNVEGLAYWPADYWTTWGPRDFLSALTGVLLTVLARDLGCGPRRCLLIGLAYEVDNPRVCLCNDEPRPPGDRIFLASPHLRCSGVRSGPDRRGGPFLRGVLAAYAAVIELQVGPVSAILGFYLLALVLRPKTQTGQAR